LSGSPVVEGDLDDGQFWRWDALVDALFFCNEAINEIGSTKNPDFSDCTHGSVAIKDWDVSLVNDFSNLFRDLEHFNADISNWDVSSAHDMRSMFHDARAFNQDISGWDVGMVTGFSHMFSNARSFNQPIGRWDTSMAMVMWRMFYGARSFNQDLSGWYTRNVRDFEQMFMGATVFNGDVTSWQTNGVTYFTSMFQDAIAFDQDITHWASDALDTYETYSDYEYDGDYYVKYFVNHRLKYTHYMTDKIANMFANATAFLAKYERAGPMMLESYSPITDSFVGDQDYYRDEVDEMSATTDFDYDYFSRYDVHEDYDYDDYGDYYSQRDWHTYGPANMWQRKAQEERSLISSIGDTVNINGKDVPAWIVGFAAFTFALSILTVVYLAVKALCCARPKVVQYAAPAPAQVVYANRV
jgi:surface protein